MTADVIAMSFEDALGELERIVQNLEGGRMKLEDAITCYERGARLREHCEAKLAEAETRVQIIVARADGSVAAKPFDPAAEPAAVAAPRARARRPDAEPAKTVLPPPDLDEDIPF